MREKPKHHLVGTRKIGDLWSSASTPPLICSIAIILYACQVVNAKSDAFSLNPLPFPIDTDARIGYNPRIVMVFTYNINQLRTETEA